MAAANCKLTPSLQKKLLELITRGIPIEIACAANDVTKQTLFDWLARGQEGEEPFAGFLNACDKANALWFIDVHDRLMTERGNGWVKLMTVLERRFRKHYGRTSMFEGVEAPPSDEFL